MNNHSIYYKSQIEYLYRNFCFEISRTNEGNIIINILTLLLTGIPFA